MPARPGIAETGAADDAGAIQLPHHDCAARILKPDVGEAVAIVVAGAHGTPARPRIAETGAGDHIGPVELPDHNVAAVVLPQDIGPPSPLKSPVPTTLAPFSSHTAIEPAAFCNRTSAKPSPLKSPVPLACQFGPGLPTLPLAITLAPSVSQTATAPLLFCHRMSDLPSPLKSALGPPDAFGRPAKSLGLKPLELAPAFGSSLV